MFAPSSFDTVGFDALSVSTLSAQVQPRVQALPYYPQPTGDRHLLSTVANGSSAAIGDANAYNRQFRENALRFAPGVMLVETSAQRLTSGKRARAQRVGLRAVRVVF